MMHGMYGGGPMWMMIFWVVLIGIGVYLLIKFINGDEQKTKGKQSRNNDSNTPLLIIQERLAKGEIDSTEYERLKTIIKRDQ